MDGEKVTNSERILARQSFADIHNLLLEELQSEGIDICSAMSYEDAMDELSEEEGEEEEDDEEECGNDKNVDDKGSWTMKQRLKDHRQDIKRKNLEEEKKKKQMDDLLNTNGSREVHINMCIAHTFLLKWQNLISLSLVLFVLLLFWISI